MTTGTGYLLGGRYQLGGQVGRGGMSEVHRGRDLRLGRDVAIKVLRSDLARDPSFQERFRREAQNAASLNHPAIVAVYDTGETMGEIGPVPYIVMEFVEGDTLQDLLKKNGPLPPRRAMEIVADICAALDFSHRHGIVHRDIKPANVMLNRAGAVKVMDFGIARGVAGDQSSNTATAAVIGTAHYLSPEQARGEAVDARSDVYSTGCVLNELLTGVPPFTGDSAVAVAYRHVREAPKPPSETRIGLPKEIDAIVLKALNKNPLNRYQTAAEMRADLVRALSGQAVRATPLMSDEERTQMMRPAPARTAANSSPPLLAPPTRVMPQDDWETEDSERPHRVWGFIGIGLLCVALLAGAIWLTLRVVSAPPPAALVAVPDLTGMSQEEATAKLRDSRLTLGAVTTIESKDEDKGKIVNQRPSSQTQVAQNSAVNLEIGLGLSMTSVPDVVGLTPDQARKALQEASLQYQEAAQASSDPDKGKAIRQDPAPQEQVAPNSTVTVTVGTGMTIVAVPDGLIGKSVDDATGILQAAGLTVVAEEADGTEPQNQVKAVDHRPGQQLPSGSPVTLSYSNNSLMIMPSLQNQTREQAASTLNDLGWAGDASTLTVTDQPTANRALIGAVLTQTPAPGSTVRKIGTPVSVGVGALRITVPNLVGKTREQATTLLDQAGATNVTFADAGTPPRGQANKVQGQSVPANSVVAAGTPITVNVYGAS